MDYRELLKKYIQIVIECEGVTFIPNSIAGEEISQEELDELKNLETEQLGPDI